MNIKKIFILCGLLYSLTNLSNLGRLLRPSKKVLKRSTQTRLFYFGPPGEAPTEPLKRDLEKLQQNKTRDASQETIVRLSQQITGQSRTIYALRQLLDAQGKLLDARQERINELEKEKKKK